MAVKIWLARECSIRQPLRDMAVAFFAGHQRPKIRTLHCRRSRRTADPAQRASRVYGAAAVVRTSRWYQVRFMPTPPAPNVLMMTALEMEGRECFCTALYFTGCAAAIAQLPGPRETAGHELTQNGENLDIARTENHRLTICR